MAPSTDKVKGIEELQVAEDDDQILGQASKFKDRVFLVKKMERNLLKGLVSGMVTPADFLANQELSSENVLLVKKLVQHCLSTHTEITCKFPSYLLKIKSFSLLLYLKFLIIFSGLREAAGLSFQELCCSWTSTSDRGNNLANIG